MLLVVRTVAASELELELEEVTTATGAEVDVELAAGGAGTLQKIRRQMRMQFTVYPIGETHLEPQAAAIYASKDSANFSVTTGPMREVPKSLVSQPQLPLHLATHSGLPRYL